MDSKQRSLIGVRILLAGIIALVLYLGFKSWGFSFFVSEWLIAFILIPAMLLASTFINCLNQLITPLISIVFGVLFLLIGVWAITDSQFAGLGGGLVGLIPITFGIAFMISGFLGLKKK